MKIFHLRTLIIISYCVMLYGLVHVQLFKWDFYKDLATKNRIRLINIDSPRGMIYDRHQNPLVKNRVSFSCAVIPQEIINKDRLFDKLSQLIDMSPSDIDRVYFESKEEPFAPAVLKRDISLEEVVKIEENLLDLPGAMIYSEIKREYPYGRQLAHILGYIGEVSRKEFVKLKEYGYRVRDHVGRSGIEAYYNDYLKGEDGGMQIETDSRGRRRQTLGTKSPSKGIDLELTIDLKIQELLHDELKQYIGAAVILDVNNGDVLALSSSPSFDPNQFLDKQKSKEAAKLFVDTRKPLLNRAISASYPPGSIFKPVVALAALNSRKITHDAIFECLGQYRLGRRAFRCWRESGHGWIGVKKAIQFSCNVFFYKTGIRVGPKIISQYASRFELDQPTGIDLPGEAVGLIPSELWKRIKKRESWYKGDTLNFSIGQGFTLMTPIGAARLMATIANGGKLVTPRIVKKIGGIAVSRKSDKAIKIKKSEINYIKKALRDVVEADRGTAYRARNKGFETAGKTGTAQNPHGKTHAWFIGFAPVKNPQVAIAIIIEKGGRGSNIPATIAGKMLKRIIEGKHETA